MIVPLLFLGGALKQNKNLKPVAFYFCIMTLVYCSYVAYVGGDFMDMFRFLVPILPLFFFLVQEGFRGMYYHAKSILKQKRSPILVIFQVFLSILILFLLVRPSGKSNEIWSRAGMDSIGLLRESAILWSKVGLTFKAMTKPKESIATTAAGAIPYYSEMYTIDQLGLVLLDLSQLRIRRDLRPGHYKKVTDEFLLSRKPTYIIGHPLLFTEEETKTGILVSEKQDLFLENGYESKLLIVKISENESRHLYCLCLKADPSTSDFQIR